MAELMWSRNTSEAVDEAAEEVENLSRGDVRKGGGDSHLCRCCVP